jgi:hypothetical protein
MGADIVGYRKLYGNPNFNPRRVLLSRFLSGVFATGLKVCGFEPGQGDGFLRAVKIRSTLSFGWEVGYTWTSHVVRFYGMLNIS